MTAFGIPYTGCFTHYANLRHHDANFFAYEKAIEWLVVYDLVSHGRYAEGDFALSPYLPYMLVPFYPLFQERGLPRVERSQADWEVRTHLPDSDPDPDFPPSIHRGHKATKKFTSRFLVAFGRAIMPRRGISDISLLDLSFSLNSHLTLTE
jgi:hypothetical protein